MGFAGFMGEIEDEQERERQAANLQRVFERMNRSSHAALCPDDPCFCGAYDVVAVCEKCGLALTRDNWWKIGGKNLCKKHGEAYAEYLKS